MQIDLDQLKQRTQAVMDRRDLSPTQKKVMLAPLLRQAKDEHARLSEQIEQGQREIARHDRIIGVLQDAKIMVDGHGDFVFQPNTISRLHRFNDCVASGQVFGYDTAGELVKNFGPAPDQCAVFVVENDWRSILGDDVSEGDFQLPFEKCAFEYRYSGLSFIVFCEQTEGGPVKGSVFCETKNDGWLWLGPITDTMWEQNVRAICVALESEVAEREVVRAPHALNAKRAKTGKSKMLDFHVVRLCKRFRAKPGEPVGHGTKKRLHFCRGHWRHYETSKTWIRWCLKGNPELGFVVKEYRA